MSLSRAAQRGWAWVPAAVLLAATLAPNGPVLAQGTGQTLLAATPLILKDGRIANVSVHVLPFPKGDAQVAPGTRDGLARVLADVATDCFLTAQVIGHVGPDEVGEHDTLGAHRLARSRADSVQTSLIDGGLPAKSIASVWDWQFLVRDARATLWVFRLTEGEDCDGSPLAPGAAGLVAEAAPPAAPTAPEPVARAAPEPQPEVAQPPAPPQAVVRAEPTPRPEEPQTAAAGSAPAPRTAASGETGDTRSQARAEPTARPETPQTAPAGIAPAPTRAAAAPAEPERPAPTAIPAGPARPSTGVPSVTQPIPAVSRAAPASEPTARPAAREPDPTERELAAIPVRTAPPEDGAAGPRVAITFATNSSYFPPGAARELGALAKAIEPGRPYRVHLLATISTSDRVVGARSAEEAALYNRWLAKRRLERVQEWLESNLAGREIEVVEEFLANDDSRRVLVRLLPAG